MWTIAAIILLFPTAFVPAVFVPAALGATPDDCPGCRALVDHYSPVILQDFGTTPAADIPTRFDFDGDLIATNNWDNLLRFATPATVYFDVIASESHWFITYGLFYPRDYQRPCLPILCHENDFEVLRLTVKKVVNEPFGKPEVLETFAHGFLRSQKNPLTVWRGKPSVVVISQAGGHGIYAYTDAERLTWGQVEYSQAPGGVSYQLLPLSWFWEQRQSVGFDGLWNSVFDYSGTRFQGRNLPRTFGGSKHRAYYEVQPPWSMRPRGSQLEDGDWFLDPAYTFCRLYRCDNEFSLKYSFHPYLAGLRH